MAGMLAPFALCQTSYLEQGLTALKDHQPQQALSAFQQALQQNPSDVAANLYAAGAALELYQGGLAVQYAERARELSPNNWKVHTTLVVAYAMAGRVQQRDAERELLRRLHSDPKAPEAVQTSGFLLDMFPVKQYRVEAVEFFQPVGKFNVYYRFIIRAPQGKRIWAFNIESNDFDEKSWEQAHPQQAAEGDRQFQITGEGGGRNVDYEMFSGKPAYDSVKARILRILNAQTAPFPGENP
jgi:tetratricopeptide (TPR) repeat protein